MEARAPYVRLPSSAYARGTPAYVKLLMRVRRNARTGFDFVGTFFRAGSTVRDVDLCPGQDYPDTPVLLEFFDGAVSRESGRRRRETVAVLWKLDWSTLEWNELARSSSSDSSWAADLEGPARRALGPHLEPNTCVVTDRITRMLDAELELLTSGAKERVLSTLHDEFATRMMAAENAA